MKITITGIAVITAMLAACTKSPPAEGPDAPSRDVARQDQIAPATPAAAPAPAASAFAAAPGSRNGVAPSTAIADTLDSDFDQLGVPGDDELDPAQDFPAHEDDLDLPEEEWDEQDYDE